MIRQLEYSQEKGVGTWLVAMPSYSCETVLSLIEFCDELRNRYSVLLLNYPSHYYEYDSKFSTSHALAYKVGSLIQFRHDESRATLVCLASAEFLPSNVCDEPLINPCCDVGNNRNLRDSTTGLIAELMEYRGDILIRRF